jgi:histidyl-tRNA synthetase
MSKKEKIPTEPYKGVRDFYPEDQAVFNYLASTMRAVVERFGYVEYHASVLEPAELYKAKGAENEEMVSEQTYTFLDRGGREVTLRPEMTPTVARMVSARRREFGFPLRLYSIPNVFRYERPQRGRLREHWQLNVDIFGSQSAFADAEIIEVAHALMTALGAEEGDFTIKLGSRNFLDRVISELKLSPDDGKKLIGLMDRRAKMPHDEFARSVSDIGVALEMLSPERPPEDVQTVLGILKERGIGNAAFDPSIVRGFNYYTGVVFEIFDTRPENNRSVFGGGRYNNLTGLFDDEAVSGVGCAAGDAALRDFLEVRSLLPAYLPPTKVYLAVASPELAEKAAEIAATLRKENVSVAVDFGEKKLGDQIKAASKHKIPYVMIVGEDELASGEFTVRDLVSGDEKSLSREELSAFFLNL